MDMGLLKLRAWASVLRDVQKDYGSSTIANAIKQIESRICYIEENKE